MPSIVNSLRSLADPIRLRLLLLLEAQELSVAEIQDVLGMGQSRTSSHLGQLKRAGLVQDRRSGKNIYYSLSSITGTALNGALREILEAGRQEIPEADDDQLALQVALNRRKDKAREYFNELAGRFGEEYVPGRSWKALSRMLLQLLPPMRIVDLGAGEGTLTQLLARNAVSVIAVDNSPKMVEFGTKMAREHEIRNLEYRLGDLEAPPVEAGSADLVIFSQALHHAIKPQRALEAAYALLAPHGRVTILDLLSHNFEEARELYADTWLGFSETDVMRMLTHAGFENIATTSVHRETQPPHFEVLLAIGHKKASETSE
jgi:ArsR family transcriptional regulator